MAGNTGDDPGDGDGKIRYMKWKDMSYIGRTTLVSLLLAVSVYVMLLPHLAEQTD